MKMNVYVYLIRLPNALRRRYQRALLKSAFKENLELGHLVRLASPEKIQIHSKGKLEIGNGSIIEEDSLLNISGHCKIGDNCYVSTRVLIGCSLKVTIGDQVAIGPNVIVLDSNHNFDNLEMPIVLQGASLESVHIQSNCWIGANSIILPGVDLANHVVVAAGSVVTKSFGPNVLIAGNPARVIRSID